MIDKTVRGLIIIFIFVFDPLAVLLLISSNVSFRTSRLAKEQKKQDKVKLLERKNTDHYKLDIEIKERNKIYC